MSECRIVRFQKGSVVEHGKSSLDEPLVDLSDANIQLPDYSVHEKAPYCWVLDEVNYYGRRCSTVILKVNFSRSFVYYILNICLLEACFVLAVLAGWGLDGDAASSRPQFDMVIIFTEIAFRSILATKLPAVSYATSIDKYIFAAFVVKFSGFAWHAVQLFIPRFLKEDIDFASAVIYFAIFVVMHTVFAVSALHNYKAREREVQEMVEDAMKGTQPDSGDAELRQERSKYTFAVTNPNLAIDGGVVAGDRGVAAAGGGHGGSGEGGGSGSLATGRTGAVFSSFFDTV